MAAASFMPGKAGERALCLHECVPGPGKLEAGAAQGKGKKNPGLQERAPRLNNFLGISFADETDANWYTMPIVAGLRSRRRFGNRVYGPVYIEITEEMHGQQC